MKRRKLLLWFVLLSMSTHAQNILTAPLNMMRTDSLTLNNVSFIDTNGSGTDVVWDFSDLRISKEHHYALLRQDTLGVITREVDGKLERYTMKFDKLSQIETITPLSQIRYEKPVLKINFPFEYGDSISAPFVGHGRYCGNHYYKEQGISTIIADAQGTIILPAGDSLRNVLRVYTVQATSICMDMDSTALDTARLKQVIEERLQWYARGYRYPVLETVISTTYTDMTPVAISQKSFCCLPESQLQMNDSANANLLREDSVTRAQHEIPNQDIIHYHVTVEGGLISIHYDLDREARITTLICNAMGIIYKHSSWMQMPGHSFMTQIDCSGLRRGQYILYVNVNGKVYNEKVIL